mgnify:CR=1 FL=1
MSYSVSVIIPVYNVEKYLDKCLLSVVEQTMKDIEIILIDDGSTDNSLLKCKEWESKDSRIKVYHQKNQGVSVARNLGIEKSMGDWIAFIDSDDWIEPNYVEELYKIARESDADISICGFYFDYSDESVARGHFEKDMQFNGRNEISQIQIQILAKNMSKIKNNSGDRIGAPWCKLFKSSFVKENDLNFIPNLKRSQDVVFNLYALEKAKKVVYTNQPLYHYLINPDSVCVKFSKSILSNVNAYLSAMKTFILTYHNNDGDFKDAYNTKVCTSVYKCMFQYFFNDNYPGTKHEMRKELDSYLNQDIFKKGLENVKYKNLDKTEKIFVFFLKRRMYGTLIFLVKMRQKFIKVLRH